MPDPINHCVKGRTESRKLRNMSTYCQLAAERKQMARLAAETQFSFAPVTLKIGCQHPNTSSFLTGHMTSLWIAKKKRGVMELLWRECGAQLCSWLDLTYLNQLDQVCVCVFHVCSCSVKGTMVSPGGTNSGVRVDKLGSIQDESGVRLWRFTVTVGSW